MVSRFCRCRTALTAACTAHWPAKLQLQQALGLVNTWLLRDQQLLRYLHIGDVGKLHTTGADQALQATRARLFNQAAGAAHYSPQVQQIHLPTVSSGCDRRPAAFGRLNQLFTYSTDASAQPAAAACSSAAAAGLRQSRSDHSTPVKQRRQQNEQRARQKQQPHHRNNRASAGNRKNSETITFRNAQRAVESSVTVQSDKGWSSSAATPGQATATQDGNITCSSSSSSSGVQGSSSPSPSKMIGDADVSYETYPLPSYQLDAQEQQSLDKAIAVINILRDRGFLALIVGGWVRDKYLGRRASDIDIATNATPWEIRRLFRHVIELPRSTVKLHYQGEAMEVTSFRGISRAPTYFSVAMDAGLRDFTLNSLYYDPARQEVLDFVGGVPDAQSGVLRFTADAAARLSEDPLRALRCVRFVTVLGLRMTPDTAAAVRQAAHMCSVRQGLPPRRIWLELRKLHRAEQQQPGSWYRSLKLCYHLGLLQPLFPWLDAAGHAARQAVQVSEKLHKLWSTRAQEQSKQQTVPLSLLVAAMLHPASPQRDQAYQQLEQYFPEPADVAPIQPLLQAAALTHNSSSTSGSSDSSLDSEAWVAVYASPYATYCVDILGAWMPEALLDGFVAMHKARMSRLADDIHRRQQLHQAQYDIEQQTAANGLMSATSTVIAGLQTAAAAAVDSADLRQQQLQQEQDNSAAGHQATPGEQEQHQQQVEAADG